MRNQEICWVYRVISWRLQPISISNLYRSNYYWLLITSLFVYLLVVSSSFFSQLVSFLNILFINVYLLDKTQASFPDGYWATLFALNIMYTLKKSNCLSFIDHKSNFINLSVLLNTTFNLIINIYSFKISVQQLSILLFSWFKYLCFNQISVLLKQNFEQMRCGIVPEDGNLTRRNGSTRQKS